MGCLLAPFRLASRLLFLGLIAYVAISLLIPPAHAASQTPPPSAPPPGATEQIVLTDADRCQAGCLGLAEWRVLTGNDLRLLTALALSYQYDPTWRPYAWEAARKRTAIAFTDLGRDVVGVYMPQENHIGISTTLETAPSAVLAAVLSHEVVHAGTVATPEQWQRAGFCVANETLAMAFESSTYAHLRRWAPYSALTLNEDLRLAEWRLHLLRVDVLFSSGYQQECLQQVLPPD